MSRRTLSPAARGVVLAVRAALRAGRVDLADQADGSTLATSTAPDGTKLMTCTLRMPVRGAADPRQLTLPAVAPVPQPAEVPPAPVAVPAGEECEPEAPAPQGEPVRCWIAQREWDEAHRRDAEAEGWLTEPVAGTVLDWADAAPWETVLVPAGRVLNELRKVCQRFGVALHEGDDAPPAPAKAEPEAAPERGAFALASGDLIELDGARVRVAHVDGEGFTWAEVDRNGFSVGEVERCLWREVDRLGETRWRILPVDTETPAQQREAAKAAKPKRARKASKAAPSSAPAGDEPDPPVPNVSVLDASHGLAVGDIATLDDEDFRVTVADEWGWQGVTVATTPQGRPLANVHCDWGDVERVGPRAWRTRPRREKTRAECAEGAPASKGAAKAPKREAAPKAKPARLTPVPEADALARYGERSVVAQLHEGDAWELVWSDEMPGHMSYEVAVSATTAQAHRVRVYNRGKHCVRDSRDGAA